MPAMMTTTGAIPVTDDELDRIAGRRDQMVGLVQERYGRAKQEAEREVEAWSKGL